MKGLYVLDEKSFPLIYGKEERKFDPDVNQVGKSLPERRESGQERKDRGEEKNAYDDHDQQEGGPATGVESRMLAGIGDG